MLDHIKLSKQYVLSIFIAIMLLVLPVMQTLAYTSTNPDQDSIRATSDIQQDDDDWEDDEEWEDDWEDDWEDEEWEDDEEWEEDWDDEEWVDDCADADNDGWCDDDYVDDEGEWVDDCTDADNDGWCDDEFVDDEGDIEWVDDCADADNDGWCDEGDFEWVDDCADEDNDGWCDNIYIDEFGDFITDEAFDATFDVGSETPSEEPNAVYDVSNTSISNSLTGQDSDLWTTVTDIVPAEWVQSISGFEVISGGDTAGYVYIDENDPSKFVLGLNTDDLNNPAELTHTIIHELAHIVTLNTAQVDDDATTCSTLDLQEGCSQPTSYINQFNSQFWASGESSNPADFVSDYARTNVAEDIAESFTAFVLQDRPSGNTGADQKIAFFYNYPELVTLRNQLRQNIANRR